MNIDIRNLKKWLNEEQEEPIDRQALARVLAMAEQPAIKQDLTPEQPAQHQCKFPMCQNEEYQQALAEQIKRELYTGEPAQPQQEPVATVHSFGDLGGTFDWASPRTYRPPVGAKLYASQPAQRNPLTNEQIDDLAEHHGLDCMVYEPFARAIEAAHGIKGDA